MDKNVIKKFAVWARRELISRVSQRAAQYEITADGYGDQNAASVHGRILSVDEKKQRSALIAQIREKGYEQVMEEIAYTWFNRFSALRFMEVNGYLPTRVRVFTDDENNFKPQILTEAINMELDGLDMQKVYDLKNANDDDTLFKYMIIVQCNALSKILPGMFQRISDYTELLFPDNLLRDGSVVEQMIAMIPQEDWTDQVQLIGWLYQYYNSEPKDQVFANLKKNIKISKENIPAATQLFTPDWIVRYMVENSLGRLWLEGHPNDTLKAGWKYYLDEAEQEPEVQAQLAEIRKEYAALKPEDIVAIDPCQGSGHILAYMFDVLVQIYEAYGYSAREAAASIVEHNIWGLDIDERATQLAYFSVMMKARQYDRRFFSRGIQPHVYAILESNNLDPHCIEYFVSGRKELKSAMETLIKELHDAKEYGSILKVTQVDFLALYSRFEEIRNEAVPDLYSYYAIDTLLPFVQMAQTIAQKYDAVVTNPPYMGSSGMSAKLTALVKKEYKDSKTDMFSVFFERCSVMTKRNRFYGMIVQPSILSLTSFSTLRRNKLTHENIINLLHMGRGIFGIDFGSTAYVFRKKHVDNYTAQFMRLHQRTFQYIEPEDIEMLYLNASNRPDYRYDFTQYATEIGIKDQVIDDPLNMLQIRFSAKQDEFINVPNSPFTAYALSENVLQLFKYDPIVDTVAFKEGLTTANNDLFLRKWYEVQFDKIVMEGDFNKGNIWAPYNKGGAYRMWYGNHEYVVDWSYSGKKIMDYPGASFRNAAFQMKAGGTFSAISAGRFSARLSDKPFAFDSKGTMFFSNARLEPVVAYMNSNLFNELLKIVCPTMDFRFGTIQQLPLLPYEYDCSQEIELARQDWDESELSWNFTKHPMIIGVGLISEAYEIWENSMLARIKEMRALMESYNKGLLSKFELAEEFSYLVPDKDISLRMPDQKEDIKTFISYAVGCMFGRYSLDIPGLVYAGGTWETSKYSLFMPDKDAIIPICDDEYFEDDVVGRFVRFVEAVYGKDTLEENLRFIADALGGKGSSREVIRNYFLNDFYADHLKVYQKRPIYWLFDSGKKNGFKCLIYMHRYQPDTIARIRTDYVHEQQSRYRTAIADLESRIANAGTSERVKLTKRLDGIRGQAEELRVYEEKIHHLADQMIRIDLDDGVKVNYEKFQDVLAKLK